MLLLKLRKKLVQHWPSNRNWRSAAESRASSTYPKGDGGRHNVVAQKVLRNRQTLPSTRLLARGKSKVINGSQEIRRKNDYGASEALFKKEGIFPPTIAYEAMPREYKTLKTGTEVEDNWSCAIPRFPDDAEDRESKPVTALLGQKKPRDRTIVQPVKNARRGRLTAMGAGCVSC